VAFGAPGDGPSLRASGPNFVSLPGYLEMLTGRAPSCQENDCRGAPPRGLPDAIVQGAEARVELAIISSWERIEHTVTKVDGACTTALVSTGRSGGNASTRPLSRETRKLIDAAREGSPAPGHDDYRPDRETIPIALSYLEHEKPRFLFVSLGDTDELAHHDDYDAYLGALSRADAFVGDVVALAETWRMKGERTAIFVTTDHGRATNFRDHGREHPESADVWMIAGGDGIAPSPERPFDRERRLRDVAHTIAFLADIPFTSEEGSGTPIAEMLAYAPSR
ncbi:MAG: alkaline phosphatase family protein, partial [Myxococcales bacterium]|nr:alkaline phosphatase family protein [Myxococcales bacterium]